MRMKQNYNKKIIGRTLGLIGLGLMGTPIANQLNQAGAKLRVWNRDKSKSSDLSKKLKNIEVCKITTSKILSVPKKLLFRKNQKTKEKC